MMSGASLSVPGLLHVGTPSEQELVVLHVGPAVGWVALKGLQGWSQEISVVLKADVTGAVSTELGVTLPEAQPEAAGLANARRAALASNLVAVESALVDELAAKGVRVHTVGSDRATGGFYYLAKGGAGAAVRVQGNLVEMVAPSLAATADNSILESYLDGVIGRLLAELSDGLLSEAQLELAAALPSLGEPASAAVAKMQTLEGYLVVTAARAARYEDRARTVVDMVGQGARQGKDAVDVPLFGSARRVVQAELAVEYAEGESGERRKRTLPERSRWFVAGLQSETMPPPAVEPRVDEAKAAAEKAAADKAAQKAAAEKAAAEKAAAEKAAAEKAAAQKVAAEKAAADKAAAEKAAAEKAAAQKAAAEKAAAEKAAAEKAAAEKAAAQKAAEKAAAEKAAAQKAAAEKAAAQKAAAEKAAAQKAAAEKAAAETAAAEKAAVEKAAVEKAAVEKAAVEKAAAEKAAAEKAAAEKAAAEKAAAEKAAAKAATEKAEKAAAEKAAAAKAAGEKAAAEKSAAKKAGKAAAASTTTEKSGKKKGSSAPGASARPIAKAKGAEESKPTSVWVWLVPIVLIAAAGAYYLAFIRHHG